MATMQAPKYLSGADLLAASPAQRQQYMSSLPPDAQKRAMADYQNALNQMNRDYMKKTNRRKVVATPSSGSGFTQNYSLGANLSFNATNANNGFLEGFFVNLNVWVDLAAGSSAVYAATASRELALISEIQVLYNGTQFKFKPYILKPLRQLMGWYQPGWPGSVVVGGHNVETDSYLTQGALPVTSGTNRNVVIQFYVPLNMLHPQDVRGLLPIDSNSTTAQINIQCASQLLGNDPVANTWYAVSGSGHAVTFSSGKTNTVQVIGVFRDGSTYNGPASLPINMQGVGTVQFQYDVPCTNLLTNVVNRQKITLLEQHYYVIHTIIDGQQANAYALESNLSYIDFVTDGTGNNAFWKYGTGTNMSVQEYFNDIRDMLGQDLDEGIWPTVYAPTYMEPDPANLNGSAVLNCDPTRGGWADVHYGVSFNSLGATLSGVTPRIETHVVFVNPQGLVASV